MEKAKKKRDTRERYILRGTLAGLGANLGLFILKFIVGTVSGSVAVTADSFNNLSDMGSTAVTLAGYKLAARPSDEKHPFGHGRIEYLSGLFVAFIILFLGVELGKEAVGKIIRPETVSFTALTLILLCLSIPVKLFLGFYTRGIGKKIHSPAMEAAAKDSLNDVLVTSATIVSAVLSLILPFSLDGYIGLGVAIFVVISGIGILSDTLGPLLGEAPSAALVKGIEKCIMETEGVVGFHDLIAHNYGPERYFASAHAEVRSDCDLLQIHDAIDRAEQRIKEEMGVMITIHLDPIDTDDENTNRLRERMVEIIREIDGRLSLHDFRVVTGETHTNLIFDLVVPHGMKLSDSELKNQIDEKLHEKDETLFTVILFDRAFV